MPQGYIRFPHIHQDRIVFVAEDDLWLVTSYGGRAERLTAAVDEVRHPHFSPDGQLLAFVGQEEGPNEIYVMPAPGGPAQRLTYQSADCRVLGWSPTGDEILYASNAGQYTYRFTPSLLSTLMVASHGSYLLVWPMRFPMDLKAALC